jgi:drug/metabolite transporter (DMT)-like permease
MTKKANERQSLIGILCLLGFIIGLCGANPIFWGVDAGTRLLTLIPSALLFAAAWAFARKYGRTQVQLSWLVPFAVVGLVGLLLHSLALHWLCEKPWAFWNTTNESFGAAAHGGAALILGFARGFFQWQDAQGR